ncbi:MAG: Lrp/AsnC family transcriptional regulator [Gloeocapsa sp. UFS-A4-WI-NPMV-4B04]|jgi:Lrp/AsnC family transcriptional regulator for asnA, asnC and gidA|nr:Lrp/AsnC family transcriptional regulator [Gloeocapsa sp. UFS-A4-WI-NPMV-4B04]
MNDFASNMSDNLQKYEIDALDLKIIEFLQADGRIAYSIIAKEIEVPETTIRYRVKRLLDENIISISAFLNTGKIEYKNIAYIELEVEPSFYEKVLEELIQLKDISYIASVTGQFNIMLEYIYQDNENLLSFINWVRNKNNVKQLKSRIILKIHKAQYPAKIKQ